jgi:pimeloyl-ACP methyl ester carboxylesterase
LTDQPRSTPTLFAWGDTDTFAPASSGQELAARMPAASVDVLEDAGHLPQLDQPEALARSLNRFLTQRAAA